MSRKFEVTFIDGTTTEGIYTNFVEYSNAVGFEASDYSEIIIPMSNVRFILTEIYTPDEDKKRDIADRVVIRSDSRLVACKNYRNAINDRYGNMPTLRETVDMIDDAAARNDVSWRVQ